MGRRKFGAQSGGRGGPSGPLEGQSLRLASVRAGGHTNPSEVLGRVVLSIRFRERGVLVPGESRHSGLVSLSGGGGPRCPAPPAEREAGLPSGIS